MSTLPPFLAGLPDDDAAVVTRLARDVSFPRGATLFDQGAAADCAYFLTTGDVDVRVAIPGGGERTLARVGTGGVLGELALVEDHRRSATAIAIEDTTALAIARSDLQALCAQYHPASLQLLQRLARLVASRVADTVRELGVADVVEAVEPATPPFSDDERGVAFDVRAFAPKLELLRDLVPHDVDELLERAAPHTVARGRWLWRAGEVADRCVVVVRGAVRIECERSEQRIAVLGPGTLAGATSLLLGTPRLVSCRAAERASLLVIDGAAFAGLADPARHVSFRFHEAMVRGLMHRLTLTGRARARREHHRLTGVSALSLPS